MSKWRPTVHQVEFDIVATKLDTIDSGNRPRTGQRFSEKLSYFRGLILCVSCSQAIVRMPELEFASRLQINFAASWRFRAPDTTSLQIYL